MTGGSPISGNPQIETWIVMGLFLFHLIFLTYWIENTLYRRWSNREPSSEQYAVQENSTSANTGFTWISYRMLKFSRSSFTLISANIPETKSSIASRAITDFLNPRDFEIGRQRTGPGFLLATDHDFPFRRSQWAGFVGKSSPETIGFPEICGFPAFFLP